MRTFSNPEEKRQYLTQEPIPRLILTMALPAIVSMLISSFYNMADTYFVGRISTEATAAVGVVFPLMSIIQALGFTFGHGSGNYISRALGHGDVEHARKMATTGFVSAFIAGAVFGVLGLLFLDPLVQILGATPTIAPYARDYALYILIGTPFMASSLVLNNQLRFQGSAFFGMIGMGAGAVINIGLDPIFIFVLDMGVGGAALATILSQIVSFFLLLRGCTRGGNIAIHLREFAPSLSRYKEILRGGKGRFVRHGALQGVVDSHGRGGERRPLHRHAAAGERGRRGEGAGVLARVRALQGEGEVGLRAVFHVVVAVGQDRVGDADEVHGQGRRAVRDRAAGDEDERAVALQPVFQGLHDALAARGRAGVDDLHAADLGLAVGGGVFGDVLLAGNAEVGDGVRQQAVRADEQHFLAGGPGLDDHVHGAAVIDRLAQGEGGLRGRGAGLRNRGLRHLRLHEGRGLGQRRGAAVRAAQEVENAVPQARGRDADGGKQKHGDGNEHADAQMGAFHGQSLLLCVLLGQGVQRAADARLEPLVRLGEGMAKFIRDHGTHLLWVGSAGP